MKKSINAMWRMFDENEVSHSTIHYLFAIKELLSEKGYARAVDIKKKLDITAGSCSVGIKNLLKKGLIIEDESKFYKPSKKGEEITEKTLHNRKVLKLFFIKVLGVNKEKGNINACKIEHLIDHEIIKKLENLIDHLKN